MNFKAIKTKVSRVLSAGRSIYTTGTGVLLLSLLTSLPSNSALALSQHRIDNTEIIQRFVHEMVDEHGFSQSELNSILGKAEIRADVLAKIMAPHESKPWNEYKKFFVTTDRINAGVDLWHNEVELFDKVEERYGVPASIILAILGVETFYGTNMGQFHVLDALTTLGFYYPPRQKFFYKELKNYLVLCRNLKFKTHKIRGSYAGAIGQPQFMPTSYLHYGVDWDQKGTIDLIHHRGDAVGSIANYLSIHGWRKNEPVAFHLRSEQQSSMQHVLNTNKDETKSVAQWRELGLTIPDHIDGNLSARLIALMSGHEKDYWLVFKNYNVLLTYNKNPPYVIAVYLLSQKLKTELALKEGSTIFV